MPQSHSKGQQSARRMSHLGLLPFSPTHLESCSKKKKYVFNIQIHVQFKRVRGGEHRKLHNQRCGWGSHLPKSER